MHLASNPETGREQVVAGLREGLADLRLVLDPLAPDEDDPLLALGRLRHRIQPTLEAAGIALHWAVDPGLDLPAWSPEAVLNIYRMLQGATHNVIRHHGRGTYSQRRAIHPINSGIQDQPRRRDQALASISSASARSAA